MKRIKRFLQKVDWKGVLFANLLFALATLCYSAYIGFNMQVGNTIGIALFWVLFIGWPLWELWIESKHDTRTDIDN